MLDVRGFFILLMSGSLNNLALGQTTTHPYSTADSMSDWSILASEIPESERDDLLDTLESVKRIQSLNLLKPDDSFAWEFAMALHSTHALVERYIPVEYQKLAQSQKSRITNNSFKKDSTEIMRTLNTPQMNAKEIVNALKWTAQITKHLQTHPNPLSSENIQTFRDITLKMSAILAAQAEWKSLSEDVSALAWVSTLKKEI
jgi:hypothetical protein